ncbi:Intraflagellar transport protein 22 [Liparis tanakae]|uniref:Intraflagellar transport protein 22 n=1 Tax=Liparis tanakae TaxID=230148 RepID=A0A4Z2HPG8_9TELE|nr:Intraflagellar transport protein 22 [Liparis tanakae]
MLTDLTRANEIPTAQRDILPDGAEAEEGTVGVVLWRHTSSLLQNDTQWKFMMTHRGRQDSGKTVLANFLSDTVENVEGSWNLNPNLKEVATTQNVKLNFGTVQEILSLQDKQCLLMAHHKPGSTVEDGRLPLASHLGRLALVHSNLEEEPEDDPLSQWSRHAWTFENAKGHAEEAQLLTSRNNGTQLALRARGSRCYIINSVSCQLSLFQCCHTDSNVLVLCHIYLDSNVTDIDSPKLVERSTASHAYLLPLRRERYPPLVITLWFPSTA